MIYLMLEKHEFCVVHACMHNMHGKVCHICMYVCMCLCVYVSACTCVCICVCVCVSCVYILYIYIYIYIYICVCVCVCVEVWGNECMCVHDCMHHSGQSRTELRTVTVLGSHHGMICVSKHILFGTGSELHEEN